ncbi:MAG: BMP family ABC transporter substrate-binding protein [Burkholderiaceae bacterium]
MTGTGSQEGRRRFLAAGVAGGTFALAGTAPRQRLLAAPRQPVEAPVDVCFVYVSPIGNGGWTYQHELGRLALDKALPGQVRSRYVEKIPEGPDADRVIRDLATQGCKLTFATSFGYMDSVIRVARAFPDQAFEHASGYKMADNVSVYNARFYEGRYLAGLIAGQMCRSHIIGYVAAMPIPEVLQGINAFTIGARSIDPRIHVRVIWTNAWYDPGREREAALTLIDQKADLVTHHTDSPTVVQAVEERGVQSIGYHSNMSRFAPKHHLVSVTHHWGDYYTARVKALLAGNWTVGNRMGGIATGSVRLEAISPKVPQQTQQLVARRTREIAEGKRHPFIGPVVSSDGRTRIAAEAILDDDALGKMDWLVEGVVGKI